MGKLVDITGQNFGKLEVIRRDGSDNNNKAMWLCRCECGIEKRVRGTDLRSGKIISCGCENRKIVKNLNQKRAQGKKENPGYHKDLCGVQVGLLKVIEFDKEYTINKRNTTTSRRAYWKCQCECGNVISISSSDILGQKVISCGCLTKKKRSENMKINIQPLGAEARTLNLIGQKFVKLTVLKKDDDSDHKGSQWVCKCDCGNIISVKGAHLTAGVVNSCGCLKESVGEYKIRTILENNNIPFLREVKFNDLKDKQLLRFDFAILDSDNRIVKLIEFDGKQHTNTNSLWHTESLKKHDIMKNDYCKKHNIPLLRISYTDINNITLDLLLSENNCL